MSSAVEVLASRIRSFIAENPSLTKEALVTHTLTLPGVCDFVPSGDDRLIVQACDHGCGNIVVFLSGTHAGTVTIIPITCDPKTADPP